MKRYLLTLCLIAAVGCSGSQNKKSSEPVVTAAEKPTTQADFDMLEFDMLEEELSTQKIIINDPIEPWNRWMFGVNDVLYFWVLKPTAQGYKVIIPEPGRIGILNFFHNITTPVRLVNCMLQGKFHSAGNEVNRFVINTTWGVLGIWDPAMKKGKIEPAAEDFGQTLAVYGLDNGCYLVWPLLGPSTLRDSVGMGGDYFLNPTFYVEDDEARISISVVNVLNKTSLHIGEYEAFKAAAVDPYIGMREAYVQYRQKQVEK